MKRSIRIIVFEEVEPEDDRRARSCTGKLRHRDAEAAEKARLSMQKKTNTPFDKYLCEFCGWHHIGHSRVYFRIPESDRRLMEEGV